MDIRIRCTPYFVLPLTRQHIDALKVLSGHHYDAMCKMASKQGGFLFGWSNSLQFDEEYGSDGDEFTVTASSNDAQLVLKILEQTSLCKMSGLIDAETAELCWALSRNLSRAYRLSNEKYQEWQTVYQGSK